MIHKSPKREEEELSMNNSMHLNNLDKVYFKMRYPNI